MAETATKIDVCEICGVGVRPDSAFCYNCGGSVTVEETETQQPEIVEETRNETETAEANGNVPHEAIRAAVKSRDRKREARSRGVIERKPVKISWEPRQGASISFIVGSIVFVVLAAILFLMAYYIK